MFAIGRKILLKIAWVDGKVLPWWGELFLRMTPQTLSDTAGDLGFDLANVVGVVCGRGRNPTLRLWPAIFSGEIDVFPSERRNMGQEIGR